MSINETNLEMGTSMHSEKVTLVLTSLHSATLKVNTLNKCQVPVKKLTFPLQIIS